MVQIRRVLARTEGDGLIILDRIDGKKVLIEEDAETISRLIKVEDSLPQEISKDYGLPSGQAIFWVDLPKMEFSEAALSFPLRAYLGLNNFCNLDCRMCYAKKDPPEAPVQLTREEWSSILEVLERYGLVEIRLGESGEPTINGALLTHFLIDAKDKGFYISLTTNGQFDKGWVDTWTELVDQPIFSIDGDKEYHDWNRGEGTFEKAIDNLRLFAGRTRELRVNTVFSRRALKGLENLTKYCEDSGVTELCLLQLRPYNKGKEHWEEILSPDEWSVFINETMPFYREKYPKLRIRPDYDISGKSILDRLVDKVWQCSAGVQAFGVRPSIQRDRRELKVYGCGYLCDEADPFVAAVLSPRGFREDFLRIWHDDLRWDVFRNPKRNEECTDNCDHFARTCFGQCTAMLRYAEINPDFEEYLHCPFSRKGKR